MRNWNLQINNPLALTLCADARFGDIDLFDDQIWELNIARNEPRSLMMHTTYGLRAQSMRVFPRFIYSEQVHIDPFLFFERPRIQYLLPNYISANFLLTPEMAVNAEYWVPDSHCIAGSYQLFNTGNKVITIRFDMAANLKPLDEGENMHAAVMGTNAVLKGRTHQLAPICMLSGDSQINDSPFPSLWQDFQIVPGKNKTVFWVLASLPESQASLSHAKALLASPWDAQIARVKMVNESNDVEILTGDEEWDLALAAAQRSAYSLVVNDPAGPVSFVMNRRIDMGYSFADEGKGLISQWKKQSAFDAYYLTGLLLPGGAKLVQKILDSFLKKYQQTTPPSPEITRRTFRDILDHPVLCTMAWELFSITSDEVWLKANIDALAAFFNLWFTPDQDKDLDGFPEWQDTAHSGLEDSPVFERWKVETQGLNIRTVEAPALAAFLYHECESLAKLAGAAHRDELLQGYAERLEALQQHMDDCWNDKSSAYQYRDYETHEAQSGKLFFECTGNGCFQVNNGFPQPYRLLIHIIGRDDTRRKFQIVLKGRKQKEALEETIEFFNVSWLQGRTYYTCLHLFTRLDEIEITGMSPEDILRIYGADHELTDISSLIPLWSGALEDQRCEKLIDKNIHKLFWGKYGIPVSPQSRNEQFLARPPKVLIPWNQLVGEGLLRAGRQEMAAKLLMNIMEAVKKNFFKYFDFQESHHTETADPSGETGHLRGYAPRRLFLESLGVQYIHTDHFIIRGHNPFPWPVTIRYKGATLTRHETDTVITFSTGQTITISGQEPREIILRSENIIDEKEYHG